MLMSCVIALVKIDKVNYIKHWHVFLFSSATKATCNINHFLAFLINWSWRDSCKNYASYSWQPEMVTWTRQLWPVWVWLRADFSNIIRSKVDWGAGGGGWRVVGEARPTEASLSRSLLSGSWVSGSGSCGHGLPPTEAPVWRDLAPAPVTGVTTIPRQWDCDIARGDTCPAGPWLWPTCLVTSPLWQCVSHQSRRPPSEGVMEWWLLQTSCQWKFN